MEVFSRPLVAVDGSFASAVAVGLALRLVRPPRRHALRFVSVVEREAAAAQAVSRNALDEAIDRACTAQVEATCTMREGGAVDAILDEALDYKATCIVVGTHARTGRGRTLLGSCAEGLLHRSTVPVFIAHAPFMAGR
jgi:nucleotide-binding universal stress UspA family protein